MSINIINQDFGEKFYKLLESTQSEINIISPFIGLKTAFSLNEWLEQNPNIKCNIITRFNREEFIRGASSIEGLEHLINAGANLYALQDLHTKLYIFDKNSVIMGSANFTFNGFYKNHEFGLYMENEPDFTRECQDYFDQIIFMITSDGDWKVTLERIIKERQLVNKNIKNRKGKKGLNEYNQAKWGAKIDQENQQEKTLKLREHDFLENAIKETVHSTISTGIWLKFEGTSENRISNNEVYLKRKRINNEYINRTFFPVRPTGIKKGDLLFLTVVSKDKDDNEVPIIVGYATTNGYNKDYKIDTQDPKYINWNNRFPYYVEFNNGRFLNDSIKHGISLIELYRELKHDVYPSTVNKPETKIESIKKRHYQKPHLQITEYAKDYLYSKLNSLFERYGYEDI
ncbi:PLD-like domain-containing protein [Salinibacillus kushneri]|uniref:PLD-like domain-containing protein n=1 Tax=Salinibacillus kushneri TaxID=237682 RepID=A0A1I0A5C7_9BACI|nr:phospholipase D family protein [Salinibacillus kushneri]SES89308.1 PLD-like domain-containing protein [Salinibacillus kushneri]